MKLLNFSNIAKVVIVAGVAGLLSQQDQSRFRLWQVAHAAPLIKPYTIHVRETSTGVEGMAPIIHDYIRAVRGDGSEVEITRGSSQLTLSGIYEAKQIKLAEGITITTRDDTQIKTTRRRNPQYKDFAMWWALSHRDPSTDCIRMHSGHTASSSNSEKVTGTSVIGGLKAMEVTVANTGNGLKVWMAPDLACELVRQDLTFQAEGKTTGTSEKRLVAYTLGEPAPSLFAVPDSFAEVGPKEAYLRHERLYRRDPTYNTIPTHKKAILDEWEQQYAVAKIN